MTSVTESYENDYYILTPKECTLIYKIFETDAGVELLQLWEKKVLNRVVANPEEGANWAFYKEGQHSILKSIGLAYRIEAGRKDDPNL